MENNNLSPHTIDPNKKHQIELFLRGKKFITTDDSFEPSTCVEVSINDTPLGITDLVASKRPRYDKTIVINYIFEKNQTVVLKCFNHDSELQGTASFPLGALIGSKNNSLKIPLETTGKELKSGFIKVMYEGITSEELRLQNSSTAMITRASFSEYINGGLNISVVVCVDFTVSNGYCNNKHSLHHVSSDKLNDYQMAIASVCGILLNYDNDKKIPIYGFGCKPKFPNFNTNGKVSHFFPCSGDWGNCAASGIQDMFNIYTNCLQNVEFSGPTYFEPLLDEVCKFAEAGFKKDPKNYTVLLILTDGVIHDMEETIELVVQAAELPISIIIVGVGKENFENMRILDDDSGKLVDEDGNKPSRDIIQFVEFGEFKDKDLNSLSEEVLQELPNQVCSFMEKKGIAPDVNINEHQSQSNEAEDLYYPQQDEEFINAILRNKMMSQSDQVNYYGGNPAEQSYAAYMSEPRRARTQMSGVMQPGVQPMQFGVKNYPGTGRSADKKGAMSQKFNNYPGKGRSADKKGGVGQSYRGAMQNNFSGYSNQQMPPVMMNQIPQGQVKPKASSMYMGQTQKVQGLGFESMAQSHGVKKRDFKGLNFHQN